MLLFCVCLTFCFLQAWTAVQVFDEGYVMNGCYQLPLYTGDLPEVLLENLIRTVCLCLTKVAKYVA